MQFTLTGGAVSAARSFLDAQPITQAQAQGEIDALAALQEEASYSAYPQERALPLSREDLVLFGADFFEATQANLLALLGDPQATETAKDSDGAELLTLQWEGAEAVLRVTPGGERCVRLSATGTALEGPRGLRVGDTLAQAVGRFEHGDTLPEGAGALYGDPAQPPYGMLVGDGDDVTLYYAIPAEWGTAALMLRFLGDVLVSMDVSYL
jgi:hypothetical protein